MQSVISYFHLLLILVFGSASLIPLQSDDNLIYIFVYIFKFIKKVLVEVDGRLGRGCWFNWGGGG